MAGATTTAIATALNSFNGDTGNTWQFGSNWSSVNTQFETFVNKYLFPKLNDTFVINIALGNRFDWLAKEIDFIGQYSEEYVILDTIPVAMNLSKSEDLMLKRNYPSMATKLYSQGILKKQKFTLNNNDTRLNFSTLADAVSYAMAVYKKKLSDINVAEERELKAMLIDYALNHTQNVRESNSADQTFLALSEAILNIQNNSEKYNESSSASGGAIGRYTTTTKLSDVAILTTDKMKTNILNSNLAHTFQVAGIDLTKRIISFDDLGGTFKTTADVTISEVDTLTEFKAFGDYQIAIGDIIPKGSVFTFDVSKLTEFVDKVIEIKPTTEHFAYIFDINKVRYQRYTKGMLKEPFVNPEFDEVTHWIHYYSMKAISPFYNNVRIGA